MRTTTAEVEFSSRWWVTVVDDREFPRDFSLDVENLRSITDSDVTARMRLLRGCPVLMYQAFTGDEVDIGYDDRINTYFRKEFDYPRQSNYALLTASGSRTPSENMY